MTDKIKIRYWQHRNSEANDGLAAAWLRNDRCESAQDDGIPSDVRAAIALLIAPELGKMLGELATWRSVFPDIAPDSVLPDRSLLEADNATLRARIAELEAGVSVDLLKRLSSKEITNVALKEFRYRCEIGMGHFMPMACALEAAARALLAKSNTDEGDTK